MSVSLPKPARRCPRRLPAPPKLGSPAARAVNQRGGCQRVTENVGSGPSNWPPQALRAQLPVALENKITCVNAPIRLPFKRSRHPGCQPLGRDVSRQSVWLAKQNSNYYLPVNSGDDYRDWGRLQGLSSSRISAPSPGVGVVGLPCLLPRREALVLL